MIKINVHPVSEEYGGDFMKFVVRESKADLPDWYKKSQSYTNNSPIEHKDKKMTIKKCMPIFDYLSTGINLHLPFSIYSNGTGLNKVITSSINNSDCKIGHHSPEQIQSLPVSDEYSSQPYKIDFPFYIEAPKGYSALYIPYYAYDNYPLLFLGAMVQVDKYKTIVNFPFFIRDDFEGKIEAGTQFMKVVFVKREEVNLCYKEYGSDKGSIRQYQLLVQSAGSGFYKNLRTNPLTRK